MIPMRSAAPLRLNWFAAAIAGSLVIYGLAAPCNVAADEPANITGAVVDYESGEGVADILVGLMDEEGETTVTIDWTGEDGRFAFESVAPGAYQTVLPESALRDSPADAPPYYAIDGARTLTLEPGAEEELVFEVRRWAPVHGVVRDETGESVADAVVRWGAAGARTSTVQTDDDGAFTVYPPADARLYLIAQTDETGSEVAGPFATDDPDPHDVELILTEPRTAALSGVAETPGGDPLSGERVFLYRIAGEWHYREAFVDSGDEGQYEFDGLLPGEYRVSLRGIPADQTDEAERAGLPLSLEADQELDDQVITPDTEIARAPRETISGRVRTPDGEPARFVSVVASGPAGTRQTRTGPEGSFTVRGLDPGEYRLHFTHTDHPDHEMADVAAGTDALEVELPSFAQIEGEIIDAETGEPITEFAIAQWRTPPMQAYNHLYAQPLETRPDGGFLIERVRQGAAHIMVRAPGYHLERKIVSDVEAGEAREGIVIALTPGPVAHGKTVDDRGDPIGNVLLAFAPFNGIPPQGAPGYTVSDGDGVFELDALPAEEFTLYGRSEGYATGRVAVEPADDAELTIEVALPRTAAIEVPVTFVGEAVGRIGVRWNPPVDEEMAEIRAQRGMPAPAGAEFQIRDLVDGRLELPDLDPGEGVLGLWANLDREGSWWGWERTVNLAPGETYSDEAHVAANTAAMTLEFSEPNTLEPKLEVIVRSEDEDVVEVVRWVVSTAPEISLALMPAGDVTVSLAERGEAELARTAVSVSPDSEARLRYDGAELGRVD